MTTSLSKQLQSLARQHQTNTTHSFIGTGTSIQHHKSDAVSLIYTHNEWRNMEYNTYYVLANKALHSLNNSTLLQYESILFQPATQTYDIAGLTADRFNKLKMTMDNFTLWLSE